MNFVLSILNLFDMKKIQSKHLAPYLPYSLRVNTNGSNLIIMCGGNFDTIINSGWKPVLRPMSDLFDLIEVAPSQKLNVGRYLSDRYDFKIINKLQDIDAEGFNYIELMTAWDAFQMILKHHFDLFGLIKKDLAINRNLFSLIA